MPAALVTCIYNKDYITGEAESDPQVEMKWRRFYESLVSESRTNVPLVIYTNPSNEQYLKKFCSAKLYHNNFEVIPLDITQLSHYKAIEELKLQDDSINPIENRYAQLVNSKFTFIRHAINHSKFKADQWFWIDAGLSYVSLIPKRYKSTDILYDWCGYTCFTPDFINRISQKAKDKVLVVIFDKGIGAFLNDEEIYQEDRIHDKTKWVVIGGLWGGPVDEVLKLCDAFDAAITKVVSYWKTKHRASYIRLFYEEPVMSAIVCNNPDNFVTEHFSSWYHEEDMVTMGDPLSAKSFYKVITGE